MNAIKAVIFDMGGTLEDLYYDEATRADATRGLHLFLQKLGLDPGLSVPDLQIIVLSGLAAYQAWREKSEIELSPECVWTDYIFPNSRLPKDKLAAEAERLMQFYDNLFLAAPCAPRPRPHWRLCRNEVCAYPSFLTSSAVGARKKIWRRMALLTISIPFSPVPASASANPTRASF